MSGLTSKEVKGLMEAYHQVYAPQEIAEEQVWEEVEEWVNCLLDEGYDLSDYTWDELYEAATGEPPKTPPSGDIGARLGRGFAGAMKDLLPGLVGQLQGKDNEALQRQRARGAKLRGLIQTGKIDDRIKPEPADKPKVSNIPPEEGTGKGGPSDTEPRVGSRNADGKIYTGKQYGYQSWDTAKGKLKMGSEVIGDKNPNKPDTSTSTSSGSGSGSSTSTAGSGGSGGSTSSGSGSGSSTSTAGSGGSGGSGGSTSTGSGSTTSPSTSKGAPAGTKEAGRESIKPKTPNPLMKGMPGQNKAELDQIRGNAALSSISQSPFAKRILSGTARSQVANQIGKASLDRSAASISAKPTPRVVQTSTPTSAQNPFSTPGGISAATSAVKAVGSAAPSSSPTTNTSSTSSAPNRPEPLWGGKPKKSTTSEAYDIVLDYLFENGHVDTLEEAHYVMLEMEPEVIQSIVEADSIAAMRERAAKRRKQRYGASDTSKGGRDDFRPYTEDDYKRGERKKDD